MGLSLREAYFLLEVKPGIGEDELKKAYRTQLKKHHPDRFEESKRAEQTEITSKILEAYALITDSGLSTSKSFFNTAQQNQHDSMRQSNVNPNNYWVDKSGVRYKISEMSTMRLTAIKRLLDNHSDKSKINSEQYKHIRDTINSRTATIVGGKVKIIF